jgi:hypothetical protein
LEMTALRHGATIGLRDLLDELETSVLEAADDEILEEARERGRAARIAADEVRALLVSRLQSDEAPAPSPSARAEWAPSQRGRPLSRG